MKIFGVFGIAIQKIFLYIIISVCNVNVINVGVVLHQRARGNIVPLHVIGLFQK